MALPRPTTRWPGRASQDVVHGHLGGVLVGWTAQANLAVVGRPDPDRDPGVGSVQHALVNHAHGPVAVISQESA